MHTRHFNLKVKAIVAADLDELIQEVNDFLNTVEWADLDIIPGLPQNVFGLYITYTEEGR